MVTSVVVGGITIPSADYTVSSASSITINTFPSGNYTNGGVTVTTSVSGTNSATSANQVTFYTIPGNPGNPTSNAPQCITTGVTLTASGTPPGGVNWYWQTASLGASISIGDASTYTVNSAGTYYIQAYSGHCWITGQGSVTVSAANLASPSVSGTIAASVTCSGSTIAVSGNTGTYFYPGGCNRCLSNRF